MFLNLLEAEAKAPCQILQRELPFLSDSSQPGAEDNVMVIWPMSFFGPSSQRPSFSWVLDLIAVEPLDFVLLNAEIFKRLPFAGMAVGFGQQR